MREYAFELALCSALENGDRLLARQLGGHVHGRRIVDVVSVRPGETFDRRAGITEGTIPPAAIEAPVGPGTARGVRDVFPDRRPEERRLIVERAEQAGFFERERRGGDPAVRQVCRYPDDWFDRLLAIENKPDLGRPGDLQSQLQTDVSLGLFDEVVLATNSHVTGAHRNRIPDDVGIWQFDPATGQRDIRREASQLPSSEPGVEILEREPGHADVRIVSPEAKQRARRRIAELAYGKGWRTFGWPGCQQCHPEEGPDTPVPYCTWAGRIVNPASECGPSCPGHEPDGPPGVDQRQRRAESSPWRPNPSGYHRRQSDLGHFE